MTAPLAAPAVLAALVAVFFRKMLFLGQPIGGLDVLDYFYPYRSYAAQAIAQGRLPLWNPDIFGGVPFLANIQTALFYPFSVLFYFLKEPDAYTWSIALHVFLGALFAYLFARQSLKVGQVPALVAGLIFGFGGFLGGQLGHLNQFSAAIWLPLLLLIWDRAVSGRLLYVVLGGLVVAVEFLAGHTQETYLTLAALLLYAAFRTALAWRRFGPVILMVNVLVTAIVVALGTALAAVQIIPTAELTSWSIRSGGLSYAEATTFSLKGSMLLNALLPPFWNRGLLLQPGGSEFAGYTGIIALLLMLAALAYRRRDAHTWFFFFLAVVAIFLALGKQNPLFPLLYRVVPGFNLFRVPARWLFLYSFSAAMLAALGAEALLGAARPKSWRPLALLSAAGAVLGFVLVPFQSLPPVATRLTWAAFGFLALVLLFSARAASKTKLFGAAILLVLAVELWLGGQSLDYNQPTLRRLFLEPLPTTQFLQQQSGVFRTLSVARDTFVPAIEPAFRAQNASGLSQEQVLAYLSYYKLRELLEPNTSMAVSLATFDGYDGGLLPLARYVDFKNALTGLPSSPDDRIRFVVKWLPNRALLDLANVRYVVADALNDKGADGVQYDLSSFIRLDDRSPDAQLKLAQPAQTTDVGLVIATKSSSALPNGSLIGTVTLKGAGGESQQVSILAGQGQAFGKLPYAEPLPTSLTTVHLDRPLAVQSLSLSLNALGNELYVNGLALMDRKAGSYVSPLVAPGEPFRLVFKGDVKIYENEGALPRAFMVHNAQLAASGTRALAALTDPRFDPGQAAVIEAEAGPPASRSLTSRIVSRLSSLLPSTGQTAPLPQSWFEPVPAEPTQPADTVNVVQYAPEHVTVDASSSRDGFLVLSDSYFPGWQVSVDGSPARLLVADYLFQGVHLPAGRHRVEFIYRPRSLEVGVAISIAGAVVCCLGLFLSWSGWGWPRRRSRKGRD